ncbi:MAG: alginate export family protein [Phycisphaerales bacterium]|nr:alginate export family protein [Phycisphaerales bacterium]
MLIRRRIYRFSGIALLLTFAALSADARAQDDASPSQAPIMMESMDELEIEEVEESPTQPIEEAQAPEPKPLPGPKYLNLRYDEDFSYLDGPEGSYRKDFFDPIKHIHLTDDLTLSIGGSFQMRLEAETDRAFGASDPSQDTLLLHRYFLHADLRYRKLARIFFEGVNVMIEDRDLRLLGIQENRWDFHQLFLDVRPLGEEIPLTVRFGRQELQYGNQRFISPLDWANTRRRFDGVKVFYEHEKFDIDAFYVRPIPIDLSEALNRKPDEYREEQHFYGLYSTYKGIPRHFFDLYFLALRDTGDLVNANGRAGDLSLYTIGGRLGGKTGPFDYEGELAGQWGKFAGDTVHAWSAALDSGFTFRDVPWTPRIGVGFDYASGDDDPGDGTHDTFNQLFPLGHKYLGLLDLVARQNILATNVNLTFKPHKKVTTRLAWHTFWNDSTRDALYNAGGAPTRRDPLGGSGHDIGNELDLTIKYVIDVHQSILLGYSHFWGNNFIRSTGPDDDADFLYFQYAFKF